MAYVQMDGQNGLWSKDGCEGWQTDRWLVRVVYGLRLVANYGIMDRWLARVV